MHCLITGASGFIGNALVEKLRDDGDVTLTTVTRSNDRIFPEGIVHLPVAITPETDWSEALKSVDVVVHLAARAHVLKDDSADPLAVFRSENTASALNLAEQAAKAGVKRLVFISSIGVNGMQSIRPFRHDDPPAPTEPYAISKHESEIALKAVAGRTRMELVIIRPPLVYGPNAPGNFARLVNLVLKRLPLPLGSVRNRRTLVALANLVDLIALCMRHPAAAGEVFLAGDAEDLSTPDLIRAIADGLGIKPALYPFPVSILRGALAIAGKQDLFDRLCGSLQVDISHARDVLGWSPAITPREGLRLAVTPILK
ncbi:MULTISPECIES: NAD-dependent epimerase/dehydratase family protein [unclassified Rhizobium]|uniref:NAD-dependent epimerase/dehydratase family protein n=1 Tax=unclassified Rhizobium TaxID=2613769 RepID=UPI00105370A2|nr:MULTISPECIES: NAD-dependent epimerase/dehydratase family protein [unclassified Rhizobium]TCS04941.1 UDP-glucose 4-epimerase [Rhizobium sp. BK418]